MSSINAIERAALPLYVIDAFTKKPFKGNSAAVCLLPFHEVVTKETKQEIAAEMKLSETAFITTKSVTDTFENGTSFGLEWFTPICEVNLCGHATLASAAVLFFIFNNKSECIEFETLSGKLYAKHLPGNLIEIDLPAYNSTDVSGKYDKVIKIAVGSLPVKEVVLSESKKLLVRLCDEVTRQEFESFRNRDDELLSASSDIVGVIVTLKAADKEDCKDDDGSQYDFISRYFAPWMGVSEDPVTGSAHSVLAPYWAKVLQKSSFNARQCSARGGDLKIALVDDRVLIRGNAFVAIRGEINF